jgi:DNA-binding NtrC family response regulator
MTAETELLKVLLVDDDINICRTLNLSLRSLGCEVTQAHSVGTATERLESATFDLILTDFRMGETTGTDLIREARKQGSQALIAVMTAFASIDNAIEVTREGAFDYLPKPFTRAQLEHLLKKVRLVVSLRRENDRLKSDRTKATLFSGMTSVASQRLEEFVGKVAPTDATLLLTGESGTGKTALARFIHENSGRASKPFVVVNCTSLAESLLESEIFGHVKGSFTGAAQDKPGKFELAHHGTLFLDEIGDLSLGAQSKLLRFLQEKVIERVGSNQTVAVDARVIAATHRNLEEAVTEGRFREDLYYRLNVFECTLVPMRHRREDLPVFIQRFAQEFSDVAKHPLPPSIPAPVLDILNKYDWPGNVREIRNVMERLVILSSGREIQASDLPEKIIRARPLAPGKSDPLMTLEESSKRHIEHVLSVEPNLDKASEILGITKVTLWRRRKEYGLP